ncbi:unnamed protein product [Brachionus calyciflorus]|uniref:Ubiquitin-like domain-containing protein n=1 Tax=Brachionus calyciflorus TaxID=104777 RepID=A0A813U645_9BILA|nr:unnamed protein product [Brachionus calyciflorus]
MTDISIHDCSANATRTVLYDPIDNPDETIETFLRKYDTVTEPKFYSIAFGKEKFIDFNTKIETCFCYSQFITVYNHKISLNINPKKYKSLEKHIISVDSRDPVYQIIREIRKVYNHKFFKLKIKHLDRELSDFKVAINSLHIKNNDVIDVFLDPKEILNKENPKKISIQVTFLSLETLALDVYENMTVGNLKIKIKDVKNLDQDDEISLKTTVSLLEDSENLKFYNITENTLISVEITNVLDIEREESRAKKLKTSHWNEDILDWRKARAGLCVEGECENSQCKAYGQMVIINLGVPVIYHVGLIDNKKTTCPICIKYVQPKKCAFNNCKWRYMGIKETRTGPQIQNRDWETVQDEYYMVHPEQEQWLLEWNSLVIETKALSKCKDNKECLTKSEICSVCLEDYGELKKFLDICDKHKFHTSCIGNCSKIYHSEICQLSLSNV